MRTVSIIFIVVFGLRQELAGLVNSGSPKYDALVSEPATASEPYGRLIDGGRNAAVRKRKLVRTHLAAAGVGRSG